MHVAELFVKNFRLLKDLKISFIPGVNILSGKNAQGKTSIIECLRLISTGKSFLTNLIKEIITFNNQHFFIKSNSLNNNLNLEIKFGFDSRNKIISFNGEPIKILSDLIGKLDTVLFTSNDFDLVISEPQNKRKFLDIQLSQGSFEYLNNLKNYNKILKSRNALLKQSKINESELDSWTNQLIETGSKIIISRYHAIERINKYSNEYLKKISNNCEALKIIYKTITNEINLDNVKSQFEEKMNQAKKIERELKYTTSGPHRDDILFYINNFDASKFASRGQLKSLAISLKFAESKNIFFHKNYHPILLIDDILSELDTDRQKAIFDFFNADQQIIMTNNLPKHILPSSSLNTKFFNIINGSIETE